MKKFLAVFVALLSFGLVFQSCLPPEIEVESVTLNKTSLIMDVASIESLVATVLPSNATYPEVTWSSSDPAVAMVQNGTVMALREGNATITATADGVSATCMVAVVAVDVQVSSISLDKDALELEIGEMDTITATIEPAAAAGTPIEWTSSNTNVAQVTTSGTVVAIAEGMASITASAGGKFASCPVTVTSHVEPEPIAVTEVAVEPTTLALTEGESAILVATVLPEDATDKRVTWTSDDETVATVDATGTVTAVAVGTATITVTTVDGGLTATCAVTVEAQIIPVSSITVLPETLSLVEGEECTLTATVLPEDATYQTVTWSSSDDAVATVSEEGVVTAVAAGTATITASCGGQTATCELTVTTLYIPVESVTLSPSAITLTPGSSMYLTATVYPENATNQEITWDSDNIAIVRAYPGGQIFTSALGTATVTVTTVDGGFTATCVVTVQEDEVHVESIILSPTRLDLHLGETGTLQPVITPPNASNQQVTWTSNNESIATVDANGVVTAVSVGNTYITATTEDGGHTALATVYVTTVPVESITIDPPIISMNVGETRALTATVLPENATDQTIVWTSLNPAIASVDENGVVTALREGGSTGIMASCGGQTAICDVRIYAPVTGVAVEPETKTLTVGESFAVRAIITPSYASNQSVTWASDNPAVATVSSQGTVTAVHEGIAAIIVTTNDGGFQAKCVVTVVAPVPPDPSTESERP